ncbi:2-hydroxymuconate tautomerase [Amphritea japonica]|uniref:Tautomerase n=1 Tax=Amphritea japonica ATCC BAA-1530 TaxID=1278309 RepID=A0A7R6P7Z1_9GAMM|nr:2-hydroxymuconate tautomerase [Amphritea japonica]BBB27579.1 4-oxalocrotonate tautomerase [Amphritea japonica ATCC BAA-1530]
MPIVSINIMEGRSDEQKEQMIDAVSDALASSLNAPKESVRIMINEMPKQHFGIGGQSAKKLGK